MCDVNPVYPSRNAAAALTVEEIQIVKEHLVAFGREDEQGNPVEEFGERVHFDGRRAYSPLTQSSLLSSQSSLLLSLSFSASERQRYADSFGADVGRRLALCERAQKNRAGLAVDGCRLVPGARNTTRHTNRERTAAETLRTNGTRYTANGRRDLKSVSYTGGRAQTTNTANTPDGDTTTTMTTTTTGSRASVPPRRRRHRRRRRCLRRPVITVSLSVSRRRFLRSRRRRPSISIRRKIAFFTRQTVFRCPRGYVRRVRSTFATSAKP